MFPSTGAAEIVTAISDAVSDNWSIFAAMIGLSVGIGVIRRFVRS